MGTSEEFAVEFSDSIGGENRVRFQPKADGSGHWVIRREMKTPNGWTTCFSREIRAAPSVAFGEEIER